MRKKLIKTTPRRRTPRGPPAKPKPRQTVAKTLHSLCDNKHQTCMRKPSRFALWLVRSAHDSGTGHRNFPLAFFSGSGTNWRRCPTLASEQNSELLLVPILGTPARAKHCVTFRRLSESGTILVPKTGTHFLETNTQNGRAQSFVYAASESSVGPGTMQQISQESFRYLFQIISRRPLRTGRMTTLPGFPQLF